MSERADIFFSETLSIDEEAYNQTILGNSLTVGHLAQSGKLPILGMHEFDGSFRGDQYFRLLSMIRADSEIPVAVKIFPGSDVCFADE